MRRDARKAANVIRQHPFCVLLGAVVAITAGAITLFSVIPFALVFTHGIEISPRKVLPFVTYLATFILTLWAATASALLPRSIAMRSAVGALLTITLVISTQLGSPVHSLLGFHWLDRVVLGIVVCATIVSWLVSRRPCARDCCPTCGFIIAPGTCANGLCSECGATLPTRLVRPATEGTAA
jgi:hypothetical protein